MANCIQCGKEFFPKRPDAKTCSPKCRRLVFVARSKIKPCPNCGWRKGDPINDVKVVVIPEGCEQAP